MRQFKPVIITALVFLVLAGAVFGIMKFFPSSQNAKKPPDTLETDGTIYIIKKSANIVKSVSVKTDFGEKFIIDYKRDNGNNTATLRNADKKLKYKTDDMDTLSGYVGILAAVEGIQSNGKDDKLFGFDKPKREIKIAFTDGENITLLLGKDAPVGDGVYIKRKDTGNVYLIGGSTTEMLMKTLKDYREITLFKPYDSSSSIMKVTLQRPNEEPIKIEYKDAKKDDSNPVAAQYRLISPVTSDISNEVLTSELLDKLIKIKSSKLIEDYPKDLAKYGLDNPVRISFTDSDENTVAFSVGKRSSSGGRYVMPEGVPTVYLTEADITFLNLRYTDIMMQLIWIYNSDQVSQIDYTLPGGAKHTLKLNITDKTFNGSYDGGTISRDNGVNLFLLSVRFTLQGAIDNTMKYGAPEYSIKMTLKNGKVTTLQLARINERQYAAIIDGKPARYYVGVDQVTELANGFKTLASGGNIPSMFS